MIRRGRKTAVLVHSTKVEAIKWTGSGDGIIAGGTEVVLWKNKSRSWEIAWKFKSEHPQTLVSATWSIEGPLASAAYHSKLHIGGWFSPFNEASKCVLVCYNDGNSEYVKTELRHPQPVSMIQWRPSTRQQQSKGDAKYPMRHVLLTCCLDGTVRLWSEIDNGRVRKIGTETNDQKTVRRSFRVAAVIEINQTLNGTLGTNVFVTWATEIAGIIKTGEGANQIFSTKHHEHEKAGKCEWLIGFGPGMFLTFWAIHCLDDFSPVRFPRVTLWKRQEVQGAEIGNFHNTGNSNSEDQSVLNKVVIMRNLLFGPPIACSLIQLLPCNSLCWSFLYTQAFNGKQDGSINKFTRENILSCCSGATLNIDGHSGKILQVAVHPYSCKVELAASLDSNGLLLLWSLSTISNCILGLSTLNPTWKLCGKFATQDSGSKYTSLHWAPSVLDEDCILLMGHAGGIDLFIVKVSQSEEEKVICYKLCTIPFTKHGPCQDGPANVFSIPLLSACNKTFSSNKFMFLAVWMKPFQALSWAITLHSCDLSGSCFGCSSDFGNTAENEEMRFENIFSGKKYSVLVNPCSSQFPDPHIHDQVTSYAVVCPANSIPSLQQGQVSSNDLHIDIPAYHMATGCSDGTLKLWRSNSSRLSNPHFLWELVGMFVAHQGPVSAISLTDCRQKIATICMAGHLSTASTLRIWESVHLTGAGSFVLEDTISVDGDVVALSWLALGNGQLLLGVCMQNELQVYAQRRCGGQTLLSSGKSLELHIWFCMASARTFPSIHDFLWGPKATAVVIHSNYFCLFGQWLLSVDRKDQSNCHPECTKGSPDFKFEADKDVLSIISTDSGILDFKALSMEDSTEECKSKLPININMTGHLSSSLFAARTRMKYGSGAKLGFWSILEVAEKLCGSLPVYHPEALLMNIYSGNWKRAYIALQHLVECLTSTHAPERRHSTAKSSHIIPQIHLSNYFEGHLSKASTDKGFQWSREDTLVTSSAQFQRGPIQFSYNSESDAPRNMFSSSSTKSELSRFVEPLEKFYELAAITSSEKMQILAIIDLLNEVNNPHAASAYGSLDEPGQRFWVAVRFQQLCFARRFGRLASTDELVVDSGLIAWAFHSDCQENLFGSILPNDPSWQEMRTLGVGFWFTNAQSLRTRMEKLARLQYLKNKDPKDCSLLYIALNRLKVLTGLFKISKDEKDKPLVGFLSRNFQEEKNKAAALKNAYVLMGRHQLELAIAFFLLGGDTSSAITVCTKNLGDEQLALVICRLVEGHGGPLERHLISKFILPSAIEKGDYWLASIMEWELGNYFQSFLIMLGYQMDSVINKPALSSNHAAFLDPSIGRYCLTLATKNSMRNAVGEQNAAILGRWGTLMMATALRRSGLPLEALELLSSSLSNLGAADQRSVSNVGKSEILHGILYPSPSDSSNWLSGDAAFYLESLARLDLAMQYLSKLMREHPSCPEKVASGGCREYESHQYEISLEKFQHKLYGGLETFEQKFSLSGDSLINKVLVALSNNSLLFIGYDVLHRYKSQDHSQDRIDTVHSSLLYSILPKQLLKATEEFSHLFSRFIVACSITCSQQKSFSTENDMSGATMCGCIDAGCYHLQDLMLSLWSLRAILKIFSVSCTDDVIKKPIILLDLIEYCLYFVCAWFQRNLNGLILMARPLLITYTDGHASCDIDMENLKKALHQISESVDLNSLIDDVGVCQQVAKWMQDAQSGDILPSMPEDERKKILGVCIWHHISSSMIHLLNSLGDTSSWASSSTCCEPDGNSLMEKIKLVPLIFMKFLKTTVTYISSYHAKQLASFLLQKIEDGLHVPTLEWLEKSSQSQPRSIQKNLNQGINLNIMNIEDKSSASEVIRDIFADPKIISESFVQEKINWSQYVNGKPFKGWGDIYKGIMREHESAETSDQDGRHMSNSASSGTGSPVRSLFRSTHTFLGSGQKDTIFAKDDIPFQNPKEIFKRNGELLEALRINSVHQGQAVLAGHKKGIIFFNWEDELPFRDQSEYIWSEADWPQNGWAGSESTPVPTPVSPGVGLGSKKGAHLGLGGATIGVGSLARPGRDLTGGGAFGIPGYAGMGASGLGWETQDDFEEFVDPPATVENISTRALSSHPSRPFFLAGSSNTHIYLWEFGKDKATATYGVLPAANVPPPYALASISAVQFDHCGHRFATAALDGTVCTWQLEVGGRSNIRPTESSLCFNGHASDVTYVTSSGSIIAASGYGSNGVNVIIWDTLAPPSTSRASIMCHEGGARSLCVFNNVIGSGSISPLIVTGGKGGDVGLHDFRYIATGRTKRHRHADKGEQSINSSLMANSQTGLPSKIGDQNLNGMLWYIPKAHLGSVTKISTIPNTSLFLTGSKDGDVKLWDANRAKLVFHWPKLHERHTFLQPNTRGFGGVVRAAVTDIQVVSHGFLTCGGDGSVKLIELRDSMQST
ncbi:uncharacterized protein LOC117931671 isoform X3 [Vitis riparia]|uniref:uncharacterized protein LOC117931671 isoform X3 n=1 Tax=Vitis riparia TaxID=96939 RepID=UPI00155B194C|nr:uncharacterized protein LOC117931671 isoform X3 [Vitis riparia]